MKIPVKIGHVVITVFMFAVQDHVKIAGIDTGLRDPADPDLIAFQGKGSECVQKTLPVGAKIQKSGYRHVAADTAGAVKI